MALFGKSNKSREGDKRRKAAAKERAAKSLARTAISGAPEKYKTEPDVEDLSHLIKSAQTIDAPVLVIPTGGEGDEALVVIDGGKVGFVVSGITSLEALAAAADNKEKKVKAKYETKVALADVSTVLAGQDGIEFAEMPGGLKVLGAERKLLVKAGGAAFVSADIADGEAFNAAVSNDGAVPAAWVNEALVKAIEAKIEEAAAKAAAAAEAPAVDPNAETADLPAVQAPAAAEDPDATERLPIQTIVAASEGGADEPAVDEEAPAEPEAASEETPDLGYSFMEAVKAGQPGSLTITNGEKATVTAIADGTESVISIGGEFFRVAKKPAGVENKIALRDPMDAIKLEPSAAAELLPKGP